jgi:hypothetical protein
MLKATDIFDVFYDEGQEFVQREQQGDAVRAELNEVAQRIAAADAASCLFTSSAAANGSPLPGRLFAICSMDRQADG